MPVLTKGEFTVSRLDDGVSSHLHVGWLMADGTFTTVYPRENLQTGSNTEFILKNEAGGGSQKSLPFSILSDDIIGKKVILSVEVEGRNMTNRTGTSRIGYELFTPLTDGKTTWLSVWEIVNNISNLSTKRVELAIDVPTNLVLGQKLNGKLYIQVNGEYIRVAYPKFEIVNDDNTDATIYTPAPSEDYANAYPKYRGEYTDTIEADSTNPDDYKWMPYLGPSGEPGPQGPPTGIISQNTVPSSPYVGMLWQCTGNIAGYIKPATYRWNGSAWEIHQFTAQNILAETFTGFVFQGVKFIGSEFISNYNITKDGKTVEGSLSIGNGNVLNDYSDSDGGVGKFTIDESGEIINQRTLPSGISEKYELTPYSLALDGETYRGSITARQLSQLNAIGDRLWDGRWHMSASQTITPDRALSSCLTGWLLEFQGYSSNAAQDTDYSYIFVPKTHAVHHSGKPMSPAVTVYGGAVTRKILYITNTTIRGHANNAASPASGAILSAVYAN